MHASEVGFLNYVLLFFLYDFIKMGGVGRYN